MLGEVSVDLLRLMIYNVTFVPTTNLCASQLQLHSDAT